MQQERLWVLIARKLTGEASDEDLVELNEELNNDPEIYYQVEMLLDYWKDGGLTNEKTDAAAIERIWEKIKPAPHAKKEAPGRSDNDDDGIGAGGFLKSNFMFRNNFTVTFRNFWPDKSFFAD